jgi:hypothetical protein
MVKTCDSTATAFTPVTFVMSFWTSQVQSHTGHAIINLKLGIRSFFEERRKNYRYHDRRCRAVHVVFGVAQWERQVEIPNELPMNASLWHSKSPERQIRS